MRKFWIICIVLTACLTFTGCPNTKEQAQDFSYLEVNADVDLSTTNPEEFSNYPNYIRKQYDDHTFWDVEIEVPSPQQFNTYYATMNLPDHQLWIDTFYPGRQQDVTVRIPPEDEMVDLPDTDQQYVVKNDTMIFTVSRENSSYHASDKDGCTGAYDFLMQANGVYYPPLSSYASERDLQSLSRQDAVEQVNNIINQLGLTVDLNPKVYPLTYENMVRATKIDLSYGKKIEEGYFIQYPVLVDGVPIFSDFHCRSEMTDSIYSYGSTVAAVVTKDGVRGWQSFAFYDTRLKEENVPVISLQELLDSVSQRLAKAFKNQKSLVNRVELCYFPMVDTPHATEVILQPVWVVDTFTLTSDEISLESLDKFQSGQHVRYFVDATTGAYLVIGDMITHQC